MSGVYCHECGHHNPVGARFCSSCGAALTPAVDERTENLDAVIDPDGGVVADVATLVVTEGHRAGARWVLEGDQVTAGRSGDSTVFLDDITVSRRHAVLEPTTSGWHVRDVGSLNGTYVNGSRVDDAILSNGDELQIGKFKLVYIQREGTARGDDR